jgi:hypothetical protein
VEVVAKDSVCQLRAFVKLSLSVASKFLTIPRGESIFTDFTYIAAAARRAGASSANAKPRMPCPEPRGGGNETARVHCASGRLGGALVVARGARATGRATTTERRSHYTRLGAPNPLQLELTHRPDLHGVPDLPSLSVRVSLRRLHPDPNAPWTARLHPPIGTS